MKLGYRYFVGLLVLGLAVGEARSEVPGVINYQGRAIVNGANFQGTGQFRFALVNGVGGETLWSNGTSAVSLTVTRGLYSVLLGDTTVANMASSIPASVFGNGDVRLRVWFNDGVTGEQLLSPDQRVAAAPYAMQAGEVLVVNSGGRTSFVAKSIGSLGSSANMAAGESAGVSLVGGINNTFYGRYAGQSLVSGNFNVAVGDSAMRNVVGGGVNVAVGDSALRDATNLNYNVAIGAGAMKTTVTGSGNVAIGPNVMADGTNVSRNVGICDSSLRNIRQGTDNTAVGQGSLRWIYTNNYCNTAIGSDALYWLDYNGSFLGGQSNNTVVGYRAGYDLRTGTGNVILGSRAAASSQNASHEFVVGSTVSPINDIYVRSAGGQATRWNTSIAFVTNVLVSNATVRAVNNSGHSTFEVPVCTNASGGGSGMTIAGKSAGLSVAGADNVTIYGAAAGATLSSGANNTLIGAQAGATLSTGGRNTFVGQSSGYYTTGDFNTFVGKDAGQNVAAGTNMICIGINAGGSVPGQQSNILLGRDTRASDASAANEFVAGSSTYPMNNVYFGGGPGSGLGWTLHGETATGVLATVRLVPQADFPVSPLAGMMMYHTTSNKMFCYDGGNWQPLW